MADPNDTLDRAGRDRVAGRVEVIEVSRDSSTYPPLAPRRAAFDPVLRVTAMIELHVSGPNDFSMTDECTVTRVCGGVW